MKTRKSFASTFRGQKGFLLPATAILLAVMSLAALKFAETGMQRNRIEAAIKTARETKLILSAARRYRQDRGNWPASIDDLKNQHYLTSLWGAYNWNGRNPWGNPYTLQNTGTWFYVRSQVPSDMAAYLTSITPTSTVSGGLFIAATQPNAVSLAMDDGGNYIAKTGTVAERTMNDHLLMGGHRITGVGPALDSSDLLTLGSADARYVNASGDSISGTLKCGAKVYHDSHLRARLFGGPNPSDDVWNPSGITYIRHRHNVLRGLVVLNIRSGVEGACLVGCGGPWAKPYAYYHRP